MANNISTIIINAPIQKVWDALTKPALVKQWQYGSDLTTDWKVGSEIRFRTEWEGKVFEQWGKVLAIIPLQLIKYNLFAPRPGLEDRPENYFVMNYKLSEEENGVKLEITQEDNREGAIQEAPQGEENPVLSGLKKLVEG
ncbi:MAG: SRPBCC domain-containing protein [Bacteroidota bacterium]|nr:SRPBCC domain-containing protein [Bacteroidota bacterium]